MAETGNPGGTVSAPLDVHNSWAWDSIEALDQDQLEPLSDERPIPPGSRTRPAIDFAQAPDPEQIPGTAHPAPLQERLGELTGQQLDLVLHPEPPQAPLARIAPLDLPPRYEWISTLGEGGQGTVELVLDRDLGRPVALKTLLPHKMGERYLLDLYREARITGQLDHPHVMTVYDAGQLPDGRLFYTMPRMPGENLHNVLVRLRRGQTDVARRWGMVPLVQVLLKASQGVGYAHARGVIHRDLKPANVLMGGHGEVLVVDWGIARVVGGPSADAPSVRRLWSQAGEERRERVRGSPPYMAPEQIQHPDQVGPAADVFCLGVILYEALTRVPPWTGSDVDALVEAVCHAPPVPPRERAPGLSIPPELEEICLRALQKFPGHRYAHAGELAEALDVWLAGGRRREAAARRLREADSMRERHRALQDRLDEASVRLDTVRGPVGEDRDADERRTLHQRVESLERAADGVLGEAVWALQRAMHDDPDHPGVREALAELYAGRFAEAERSGNRREQAVFRALLRQFDDGRWGRWLRTGGELTVATRPEGVALRLLRLVEVDGLLVPAEAIEPDDDGRWQVPPGRYALARADADEEGWHYPIRLDREDRRHIVIDLTGEGEAGEEFAFVPGGPALLGGDRSADGSSRHRRVEIGPVAVARHPVTVGAYARFLAWVGDDRPAIARRHRPDDFDAQQEAGANRPVRNVRLDDAEAYCDWLSAATGRVLRLPTADEWEKAARGADGRPFPWGERFDEDSCASLYLGAPGSAPPAVGLYDADCSPFGVRDLAGGVWEWTDTMAAERQVVVGGSVASEEAGCRCAVRRALHPGERLSFLGFRVVMDV